MCVDAILFNFVCYVRKVLGLHFWAWNPSGLGLSEIDLSATVTVDVKATQILIAGLRGHLPGINY